MATKLSIYAERVIEAGWLLAIIVTPLFFDVRSNRVFEPDKVTLLRSIALLLLAALLVRALDGGGLLSRSTSPSLEPETATNNQVSAPPGFLRGLTLPRPQESLGVWIGLPAWWKWVRTTPLVVPTVLLMAASFLSTLTSIAPQQSLWGSYARFQGTYTTFSYISIFFSILLLLHRRDQLERILTTIVLVSLPISLYGVLQHFGLDALPWASETVSRVGSTVGNTIFMAAFLAMCVPVTLGRLISTLGSILEDRSPPISRFVLASSYACVLLLQFLAIFYSRSRGPWLGLLGSLYVFGLFGLIVLRQQAPDRSPLTSRELAQAVAFALGSFLVGVVPAFVISVLLKRGLRWLWLSWAVTSIFLSGFIVALNLPHSPLPSVRQMLPVGRLANVFETGGGTGKARLVIWQGATRLIAPHEPVWSPTAGPDRLNALRPLIGYGPETMHLVFGPFVPPELARIEAPDVVPSRSHNETLDSLVQTGLLGFLTYIFLFTQIFYYGLKWLGLISTTVQRNAFLALWLFGGGLAALGFRTVDGSWRFLGVALPAGMIFGMLVYVTTVALRGTAWGEAITHPNQLVLIALFSALLGHFIEIQFGIAVASTRTYFWTYTAVLVVAGYLYAIRPGLSVPREANAQPVGMGMGESQSRRKGRGALRRTAPSGAATGSSTWMKTMVFYGLLMAFILVTLGYNLFGLAFSPKQNAALVWSLVGTLLIGGGLVVCEAARIHPAGPMLARIGVYTLAVLGWSALYLGASIPAGQPGNDLANLLVIYYLFLALMMAALAACLAWRETPPAPLANLGRSWISILAMGTAIYLVVVTNVNVIRADIYFRHAWLGYHQARQLDLALPTLEKALQLAPGQDFYYPFLAQALMDKALSGDGRSPPDAKQDEAVLRQREALIRRAEKMHERARDLNPLDRGHTVALARLHRLLASLALDGNTRRDRFALSLKLYEQAMRLSPNADYLYDEWGRTNAIAGQFEEAIRK